MRIFGLATVATSPRRLKRRLKRLALGSQSIAVLLVFPLIFLTYSAAYPLTRHLLRRPAARTVVMDETARGGQTILKG